MSGSPAAYLKALALESGMRPEWFDDVRRHTPPRPVRAARGGLRTRFYENRAKQLLELVRFAMGKRTVSRDAEAG